MFNFDPNKTKDRNPRNNPLPGFDPFSEFSTKVKKQEIAADPVRQNVKRFKDETNLVYKDENLDENFEFTPWLPPNVERAKEYKNTRIFKGAKYDTVRLTTTSDLSVCVNYHFMFAKTFSYGLCFMAFFSLPALLFCFAGQGVSKQNQDMVQLYQFTIGNIGTADSPGAAACTPSEYATSNDTCISVMGSLELPLPHISLALTVTEFLQIFIFFCTVYHLQRGYTHLKSVRNAKRITTATDYTVLVRGLPKDTTEADLIAHFSGLYQLEKVDFRKRLPVEDARPVQFCDNSGDPAHVGTWVAECSIHKKVRRYILACRQLTVYIEQLYRLKAKMKMFDKKTLHKGGPKEKERDEAEKAFINLADKIDKFIARKNKKYGIAQPPGPKPIATTSAADGSSSSTAMITVLDNGGEEGKASDAEKAKEKKKGWGVSFAARPKVAIINSTDSEKGLGSDDPDRDRQWHKEITKPHKNNKFKATCAFVCFEYNESFARCIEDYQYYNYFPLSLLTPKALRLKGKYRMSVTTAPRPHQVVWENIDMHMSLKLLARLRTVVVALVLIILCLVVLILSAHYKNIYHDLSPDPITCNSIVRELYTSDMALQQDSNLVDHMYWVRPEGGVEALDAQCASLLPDSFYATFATVTLVGHTVIPVGSYNFSMCANQSIEFAHYKETELNFGEVCPQYNQAQYCPCISTSLTTLCAAKQCGDYGSDFYLGMDDDGASNLNSTVPSVSPSVEPSLTPSAIPSISYNPTISIHPSESPSETPSQTPSLTPTVIPTITPSLSLEPTISMQPSIAPSIEPSPTPSTNPSVLPSVVPSITPSEIPSTTPTMSAEPTTSLSPSTAPSESPTETPTSARRRLNRGSNRDSNGLHQRRRLQTTDEPTVEPSQAPSEVPSKAPTELPSETPTVEPSEAPSEAPTEAPSMEPTVSQEPTVEPSEAPSAAPSAEPSASPTMSIEPSAEPTASPSIAPSAEPSAEPTTAPSYSFAPTPLPSTLSPSEAPSAEPTLAPTYSMQPTLTPSAAPSVLPSEAPSATPSVSPTAEPSETPSTPPTPAPNATCDSFFVAGDIGKCYCSDTLDSDIEGSGVLGLLTTLSVGSASTDMCGKYNYDYMMSLAVLYVAIILTAVINAVLKRCIMRLVKLECHIFKDHAQDSLFTKLFIATYVNMAVVILIAFGSTTEESVPSILWNAYIFRGPYKEMDAGWYGNVGFYLVITFLFNSFVPILGNYVKYYIGVPLMQYITYYRVRTVISTNIVTQRQLDTREVGPMFDVTSQSAQLLARLCVAMTFAPGMPILTLLCAVAFICHFNSDKFFLCWYHEKPPHSLSEVAIKRVLFFLPYCAILRLCMGCWMFSAPDVLSASFSALEGASGASAEGVDTNVISLANYMKFIEDLQKQAYLPDNLAFLYRRITRGNVFPLFILLVFIIAIMIIRRIWPLLPFHWMQKFASWCYKKCFAPKDKNKVQKSKGFVHGYELIKADHYLRKEAAPFSGAYFRYLPPRYSGSLCGHMWSVLISKCGTLCGYSGGKNERKTLSEELGEDWEESELNSFPIHVKVSTHKICLCEKR